MVKIAIQGHPNRGKEVIQILESLGGINSLSLLGTNIDRYYYIYDNNAIMNMFYDTNYKTYTLEEFEKEFPFKVGDKVITPLGHIGTIISIKNNKYEVFFKIDSALISPKRLKLYKEMKEERNITLTLDKAKEWYKKGGELREIALQAFTEKKLTNTLPISWEEFCNIHSAITDDECFITSNSCINNVNGAISDYYRSNTSDRNICPSRKSAEAHLALIQLEQLRDCYRQGDIPDFNNYDKKYCIIKTKDDIHIAISYNTNYFLSFTKKEVAKKFLTNFKPLIKIAEDYI